MSADEKPAGYLVAIERGTVIDGMIDDPMPPRFHTKQEAEQVITSYATRDKSKAWSAFKNCIMPIIVNTDGGSVLNKQWLDARFEVRCVRA